MERAGFEDDTVETKVDSHCAARQARYSRPGVDSNNVFAPFTSCLQNNNRTDSQNRRIAILGVISKAESSPGAIARGTSTVIRSTQSCIQSINTKPGRTPGTAIRRKMLLSTSTTCGCTGG